MSNNFNKPGQQKQASKHVVFKINQCQFKEMNPKKKPKPNQQK